jgi:Tfp pilus assembly protein PilN
MIVGLNLATKPLVSHRRFFVGSALLGIFAGLLFLYLSWQFYTLRKADEVYRAKLGKIEQEMDRLEAQRADLDRFYARDENHNLQDRAKFVGTVIEARSFNWTKMFMDLEHTLPPGVHVLKIEPKLENGSALVKFVVAGSSQESKVRLLKAFEDSSSFTHVELTAEGLPKQSGSTNSTDVFLEEFSAIYTGI